MPQLRGGEPDREQLPTAGQVKHTAAIAARGVCELICRSNSDRRKSPNWTRVADRLRRRMNSTAQLRTPPPASFQASFKSGDKRRQSRAKSPTNSSKLDHVEPGLTNFDLAHE